MLDVKEKISSVILYNLRLERIWKIAQVDFKKRYYNSILGLMWAFLNPLLNTVAFFLVFTYVFKVKEENFAFLLLSGMIVWQVFAESSNRGIRLLLTKKYLFENVQYKNIDLYFSSTVSVFLGFIFNLFAYLAIASTGGIYINIHYLYLPLILLNLFLLSMGISMILSVVFIYLKDIQQFWSVILLFGFWTSGVFMRGQRFLDEFPPLEFIHPVLGLIMNFRKIVMYDSPPDFRTLAITMTHGVVFYILGAYLVKRYSHKALEKL